MGRASGSEGLIAQVRDAVGRHVPGGGPVVVGVSGGPDSVALLHLLAAARPDVELLVGHVRHGLRDDSADVAAVRHNAAALGAELCLLPVTVSEGEGPEDAARAVRLAALTSLARRRGAVVALGHTADDQAETLLLRVARGTGPDGLAGMRAWSERDGVVVLRPLLGLRRAVVRAVAAAHPTVEDPTNADPDQRRARARREALPALGRLRPDEASAVPALTRLAELAADDAALLEQLTATTSQRFGMAVVVRHGPGWLAGPSGSGQAGDHEAEADALRAWHTRVLRRGWARLPDGPPPPPAEALRRCLQQRPGDAVDLPGGVRVHRTDEGWVLVAAAHPRLPSLPLRPDQPVVIPGHAMSYRLLTPGPSGTSPGDVDPPPPPHRWQLPWLADLHRPDGWAEDHLIVRGRRAGGDRAARRALQRYPAPLRDHVPLVCTADGLVLMVAGHVLVPPAADAARLRVAAESVTTAASR